MTRYREFVDRLIHSVLQTPGHTDTASRQAALQRAAALGGRPEPATTSVQQGFERYVTTVGRWAYRVTDADVAALKAAGFSEDAIFELTVSTAVGAALGRLERGLEALRGAGR